MADTESSYSRESSVTNEKEKDNASDNQQISKEFQENVVKFVKLDDLIRKKQEELAELKSQKKPCEEFILKYMDKIGETMIEISHGKLRKNKSETKRALSQDDIKKAISTEIKDINKVEQVMKTMDDGRPLNTHINLKRTGERITKGKKRPKKVEKK